MEDTPSSESYVSRAGQKLAAALEAFGVEPDGWVCADLGSHVGGFVDCLLRREAGRVHSVDTSYGTLAWKLRRDPRVVVHERTNALHFDCPEPVDLVTIDVGWTRQRLILPHARKMLGPTGIIITLIKPHYEAPKDRLNGGVLPDEWFDRTVEDVLASIPGLGFAVAGVVESPIRGRGGNREVLAKLVQSPAT